MTRFISEAKPRFEKVIEHVHHELSQLRTGRATPALVEHIHVEAYGQKQPLKALASISVPDAQTIVVQPWDRSVVEAIERAIRDNGTNLNPVNEGHLVRVPIPALTQETRREIVKVLNQKLEQARIQLRSIRDDVKSDIAAAEKNKEVTEDERYDLQEKLDEEVKKYNERIKDIGEEKEQAIMKI